MSQAWKKYVVGENTPLDDYSDEKSTTQENSNIAKTKYGINGKLQQKEKKEEEVQQRIYITGFEHHPYYGPDKYKQELAKRGFRPRNFADQKYGATSQNPIKIQQKQDAQRGDTRFSQKMTDFRQIQDDDPYAPLFGERESVTKARVKEWQAQFERENAAVEIPYDRDGFAARIMPNWFVRLTCRLRENAGFDPIFPVLICICVLSIVSMYYIGTNRMKGEEEDIKYQA